MTMQLTRRDALAALAAGGIGIGGGSLAVGELAEQHDAPAGRLGDDDVGTLTALAEVIYPTEVATSTGFVRTSVQGLPGDRQAAMREAVARLDEAARRSTGRDFAALSPGARESVLDRVGTPTVSSDPTGSVPERIRYHLVNTLLYALFTTPKGSSLVGIRNPTGYPGGYESLTRAPEGIDD